MLSSAALLCGACSGETGTLSVGLVTAPGSTLLDTVQTLRLTLTNPKQVVVAERMNGSFELALEVEATGEVSALRVEGFDGGGALVANGASPPFPLGALTGRILIYMAAPLTVAAAPAAVSPARSELAIAALPYGAILAGGRLDGGAPSGAVDVYNAYDHSLASGMAMPAPRAGMAMFVGAGNGAYMFGGSDEAGVATANLWRFDTTAPPSGTYLDFGEKAGFARAGEIMLPLGNEQYVISGAPAAELSALNGAMTTLDEVLSLPPAGVTVVAGDAMPATLFAGATGVIQLRGGVFTTIDAPGAARADVNVVGLPDGKVIVVCGTTDGVRIDAASGAAETFANVPSLAKSGCAAAATQRHLIIAGGTTGTGVDSTVEIYDAATLERLATATLVVPRTDAVALALPNDQILIAGGVDAGGAPVGTFELFTPPVE